MKLTFGDSKKFANVHIFEAIKKEPDVRVVEISGMVSWEKPGPDEVCLIRRNRSENKQRNQDQFLCAAH